MRNVFRLAVLLGWALWLGGLIVLFLFVQALFARRRDLATQAAPFLFLTFEKYQLVVGAAALLAAAGLWASLRSRPALAAAILIALAGVGAGTSPFITNQMERLRQDGRSNSPEFRKLHGQSMIIYTSEAVLLLGAGVALSLAAPRREG